MGKLFANDYEVGDVEVDLVKTNFDTGDVHIYTEGKERLVVADSEPAPTPDPEPTPEPPSGDVMRRYDFADAGKEMRGYDVIIPKGAILSSRIPAGMSGSVNFQQLGDDKPKVDFWISEVAGGAAIDSNYCSKYGANFTISTEFTSKGTVYSCPLNSDKPHYLNIRHTDPDQPASRINRKIYS